MTRTVEHLIFLHGRNARRDDKQWMELGLDPLLALLDRSGIDPGITVHRPYYGDLLGRGDDGSLPESEYPTPLHEPLGEDLEDVREAYARRRRELLSLRGRRPPHGVRGRLYDRLPTDRASRFVMRRRMPDVNGYVSQHRVRRPVMQRLNAELPHEGRMVIVGHSLGSVIALDYLNFLPRTAYVELLITLGSPLPNRPLREKLMGAGYNWPWANLGGWINLYDPEDIVTGGEPLEPEFRREVVDVQVDNGRRDAHRADGYLSHGVVVRMAGDLLSRDLSHPLPEDADAALIDAVLIRSLARRIEAESPVGSQQRSKMAKAREHTEAALLKNVRLQRPELDTISFSLTDVGVWLGSDAARLERVLALIFSDPFAPFETEYRSHEFREGVRAVGLALGVRPRHLRALNRVIAEARAAHEGRDWKALARTAGRVALWIAAPWYALSSAVAGGWAGAAATTHGMAVASPTAGSGLMAGVGVVGAAAAGGTTSAARQAGGLEKRELEAELARLQAAALLEKRLSMGTHGRDGRQALIALSKELERLAEVHREVEGTDSRIASDLEEKRKLADTSLTWLNERFDRHDQEKGLR